MCLLHATDDPALTASAILHLLSALGRRDKMSSRVRVGREVKPHIAISVSLPSDMEAIGSASWECWRLVLNKPYSWEQIRANSEQGACLGAEMAKMEIAPRTLHHVLFGKHKARAAELKQSLESKPPGLLYLLKSHHLHAMHATATLRFPLPLNRITLPASHRLIPDVV